MGFRRVFVAAAVVAGLLVAPRAQAGPEHAVYMAGDSVMLGTQPYQDQALPGWSIRFEARSGLRTDHFIAHIHDLYNEGYQFPQVVVLHIGNNEWDPRRFRRGIDTIQSLLPNSTVVWLNLREWNGVMPALNGELDAAARRWPNMEVADWRTVAATVDRPTWNDNVHLTPQGDRAMAGLVARTLAGWSGADNRCGPDTSPERHPSAASGRGYWLLDSNGAVHGFDAPNLGDLTSYWIAGRPVAMRATPTGDGYWIVDDRGGVHSFGDAHFYGDMTGVRLAAPITGMEIAPGGTGYWLVAADGGVFAFNAPFRGSTSGMAVDGSIRAVVGSPSGLGGPGYWTVSSGGGVYSFGAAFHGSAAPLSLSSPVGAMAAPPGGSGYWLYSRDGGVFSFDVPYYGSIPAMGFCNAPRTMALRSTATGGGYWIATNAGRVFSFGDAAWHGDDPDLGRAQVIDLAVRR